MQSVFVTNSSKAALLVAKSRAFLRCTAAAVQHRHLFQGIPANSCQERLILCSNSKQWRCFTSSNENGFLHLWRDRVAQGHLHPDKAQERAAKRLHRLQTALAGYSNEEFFRPRPKPKPKTEDSATENEGNILEKKMDQSKIQQSETESERKLEEESKNVDMNSKTDKERKPKVEDENQQLQSSDSIDKVREEPPPPPLPQVPRGLYIWGPVGTGKSLLMDTFYSVIDVPKKQRFHFHAFMADVHARVHKLNQLDLKEKGRNFHPDTSQENSPIVRVALQFSKDTTLLCLDEFQVTDVADAMILSQLFDVLFLHGTVVVATSNRPPQDLYEGGLNRSYFLPFLDILGRHCIVHSLESSRGDYRKFLSSMEQKRYNTGGSLPTTAQSFFFQHQQNNSTTNALDAIVQNLLDQVVQAEDGSEANNKKTENLLQSFYLKAEFGRTITIAAGDPNRLVAKFHFEELCDGDYGASDYRALAQHFSIIALESIPPLSTFHHNRARRFITLIDEIYEAKCALVCSTETAVASPDDLFRSPGDSQKNDSGNSDNVEVGETLGIEDVQTQGGQPVSTLASVRELSFAFKRAASRMTEMTSKRWWNQILEADGWKIG